eukprot:scaffold23028_cov71-Phaeocystis_antarctica.AAC.2
MYRCTPSGVYHYGRPRLRPCVSLSACLSVPGPAGWGWAAAPMHSAPQLEWRHGTPASGFADGLNMDLREHSVCTSTPYGPRGRSCGCDYPVGEREEVSVSSASWAHSCWEPRGSRRTGIRAASPTLLRAQCLAALKRCVGCSQIGAAGGHRKRPRC